MSWTLAVAVGASLLATAVLPVRPLQQADGTLESVDAGAGLLKVRCDAGAVSLKVTRATTIFVKGRTGTLEELSPGAHVRAAYEGNGAGGLAQWLEVAQ